MFVFYHQPAEFKPNERTWFKMENEWPYKIKFHPKPNNTSDQMCENLKCNWVKSIDRYDNNLAANRLTSQQQARRLQFQLRMSLGLAELQPDPKTVNHYTMNRCVCIFVGLVRFLFGESLKISNWKITLLFGLFFVLLFNTLAIK